MLTNSMRKKLPKTTIKPKKQSLFISGVIKKAFFLIRWLVIIACFCFVVQGWIQSASKYISKKTSVSTTIHQTYTSKYPSITLCPGTRSNMNLRNVFVNYWHYDQGISELTDDILNQTVDDWTYKRTDFIAFFSHPKDGDPFQDVNNIVHEDSYWRESIPDETLSGKCFTYDPSYESFAGKWYGIMFAIRFPDDLDSDEAKFGFLQRLQIFIHPKDSFIFYKEDDMPSSYLIDNSDLKLGHENSLALKYSKMTVLDRDNMPCASNSSYSFLKCFELHWAQERGCQKPWFHFDEFHIPMCRNISGEIDFYLGRELEWSQAYWPKLMRTNKTGCPVPCTDVIYEMDHSYSKVPGGDLKGGNFTALIWFKNFRFNDKKEFIVCDWTCLIGEIGGNFGFFLGGSILALYDLVYGTIQKKI